MMEQRPNVVLIVMDAVRFDHLSCYGYERPTTPYLESLAEEGVTFDNAFATAPWTPPSHASLFTGTYPSRHGVDVDENLYLHEDNVTLAQILASKGYRTFAVLPDGHLSSSRGFHRGFQDYIEVFRLPRIKPDLAYVSSLARNIFLGRDKRSYLINKLTMRWLAQNATSKEPFFAFINFKGAHNRYCSPWPFSRLEIKPYPGQDVKKLDYFSKGGGYPYMAGKVEMSERDFEVVKSWYDGAIACIDSRIRDLVGFLKKLKVYDNTLFIITADHGENFGERNLAFHLFSLGDSLIHVPLLLHCPSLFRKPARVPHLVSLTDVLPTLLELLEIEPDGYGNIQGKSLLPFNGREYHPHVFAEFDRPTWMLKNLAERFAGCEFSHLDRGLRCVRTAEYKLIMGSDGSEELFHLPTDPEEKSNVHQKFPQVAAELRDALIQWLNATKSVSCHRARNDDDEMVKNNLRDLGYI